MKSELFKFMEDKDPFSIEHWENSGFLHGLENRHKIGMVYCYGQLFQLKNTLTEECEYIYLVCLRRIYRGLVIETSRIKYVLDENVIKEIKLDIEDIINYVNGNYIKTLKAIEHLKYIDQEAESCSIICDNYINKIIETYRDDNLRKKYLRTFIIDDIIE